MHRILRIQTKLQVHECRLWQPRLSAIARRNSRAPGAECVLFHSSAPHVHSDAARRVRGAVGFRASARSGDAAAGPGLGPSPNAQRDSDRREQWTGARRADADAAVGAQYVGAVPQLPPRGHHANQYTNTILASTTIHSSLCVHT